MKTLINEDLAIALDPVLFARTVGIDPDKWQQKLLLSTHKRILLNCCRQAGKSTIVAIYALWKALNKPDSLVLVLSPSLRQSSELFKKVIHFYEVLNKPTPADTETALTLELSNGSRIVSLPGTEKTIRGYSGVSLLLLDEAALVDDDLYRSVRPMIAVSDGRLIALSTPRGTRGFFHEAWKNGGPAWERYRVTADECPRISKEFLEQERRDLGERWFAQEYLCSFEEREAALFRYDVIQRALCDDIEELDIDLEINANDRSEADHRNIDYLRIDLEMDEEAPRLLPSREQTVRYCVGIDLGQRRDPTAITVVEVPYKQPYRFVKYLKRLQLGLLYADVVAKVKRLDEQLRADAQKRGLSCLPTYILDSTGVGEGVSEMIIRALPNANIRKCYLTGGIDPREEGIQIKLPKTQMASTLVALFDDGRVKLPRSSKEIEAMVEELRNYEIRVSEDGHDQYGAFKIGAHDDLVTALGLACWYAERYKAVRSW